MVNAISTLIGVEVEGEDEYAGTLYGNNGSVYAIPYDARRVMKFNPVDKSITYIGPDFGDDMKKWFIGVITDNGIICCPPCSSNHGILKIDTNTDTVTELDGNLLQERGNGMMWVSCAATLDGCIYFMPYKARRIMKLDPNNNDAISSAGDNLGDKYCKFIGTVIGIDGCVYGIPTLSKRIVKYDPISDTASFVGEVNDEYFGCNGNGALARDGCIYAITLDGRVLKIDTTNSSHCFVGSSIEFDHYGYGYGWSDAILGIDGCIYWPPHNARRILKYDPHSDQISLVGDDYGNTAYKWHGGSLASDGVIYCIPRYETRILSIDPWNEYTSFLQKNMVQHPAQLGCVFHPSDDILTETNFDRAVIKFGYTKVFKAFEACTRTSFPSTDEACAQAISNLYPFIMAASYRNSDLSVIYQLLRQIPTLMNCSNRVSNV